MGKYGHIPVLVIGLFSLKELKKNYLKSMPNCQNLRQNIIVFVSLLTVKAEKTLV